MRIGKGIKYVIVVLGIALTMGCSSGEYLVKDPTTLLEYLKGADEQTLSALTKAYNTTISKNRKANIVEPGLFADYACALAQQGKAAEANVWFNKEMESFPASKGYVIQLKRKLIPEYVNSSDTSIEGLEEDGDEGKVSGAEAARRTAAEERAATVMEQKNKELDDISGGEEPTEGKPTESLENDEETLKEQE